MTDRFVMSKGARLWTTESGTGTPTILFNGGPGCDDYLAPVAQMVEDRCRVIRFEPRGCGRSEWDGRYDLETLIEDAEAIRTEYRVDRWIVAGHSAGVNSALAYALRFPDRVIGLIGLSGGRIVDDRSWSETYHEGKRNQVEDTGGIIFHADPMVNDVGNSSWKDHIKRPELLRELADLDIPCVFINASEDIRPNWPTRQLACLIPGARYVEVEGAAHFSWLAQPDRIAAELREAVTVVTSSLRPGPPSS